MHLNRHVTRTLHDEHMATMALVERLESFLGAHRKKMPDAGDGDTEKLMRDVKTAVEGEITVHFGFEEELLFPLLVEAGAGDIGALLTEEHNAITPLARELVTKAEGALAAGFDAGRWESFCQLAGELIERMISHIQKEEMALLFALEELVDEDTDSQLAMEYASRR